MSVRMRRLVLVVLIAAGVMVVGSSELRAVEECFATSGEANNWCTDMAFQCQSSADQDCRQLCDGWPTWVSWQCSTYYNQTTEEWCGNYAYCHWDCDCGSR